MSKLPKLGILGSGSGSNCQSIYDAIRSGSLRAEIAVVMSDNPDAYILERARSWGIPAEVIDCGGFKTKFPGGVPGRRRRAPEGIRRGLRLPGRIHAPGEASVAEGIPFPHSEHSSFPPSFLPGLHAWEQAVKAGAAESGCTVHYVDDGMDTGPILGRRACPCCRGIRRKACTPAFRCRSMPFIPP